MLKHLQLNAQNLNKTADHSAKDLSFDDMIDMKGYEIMEPKLREDGRTDVQVKITTKVGTERLWTFIMVQRTFGMYTGCWQSHRVLPSDSKWIDEV